MIEEYNKKALAKDLMSAFLEMVDAYDATGQTTVKHLTFGNGKDLAERSYSIVFKDVAIRLTIGCNSVYFAKIEELNNDRVCMKTSEDNIIYAIIGVLNVYIHIDEPEMVVNAK